MSTPIRQQYLDLRKRYPGTILFFRLGDFYETFDDDAKLVAQELQITLTSKPMGKDLRVPLAGVPYHSIDQHVAKLVARGYRVAICEQLADPSEVKGLVPRDVVRIVTAGTVTSEASLEAGRANYLGALVHRGRDAALALADVTTGEVRLVPGDAAAVELGRSPVAELLVEDLADAAGAAMPVVLRPLLSDMAVDAALAEQFGEHAREALVPGPAAAAALAHLLAYLRETFPAALGSLQRIRAESGADELLVDERTLRNLDVFPGPGRTSSLLAVIDRCRTAMGTRLLRHWLAHPLRDPARLAERHDAVGWAAANPIERERVRSVLRAIPDLARLAGRVGARTATPRDLAALRDGLRAVLDLGALLSSCGLPPLLEGALRGLSGAAEPLATLDAALAEDPPAAFDDGGVIRPGFSPEIDSLHALTRDARSFLLGLERLERERTGIKSLKVGHNKVFGYYIEVSAANVALVPPHYQRRQTLVGAERYVTEELKEHEARLVGARERLVELERQAFASLLETLAAGLAALQSVADAVALVDVVLALGEVAADQGYTRPVFTEGDLVIRGGRHPVVEAAVGPGRFVPNDCVLDSETQILVVTGPNMSGKSTFLRQVALIALMAQAGSFVPAAEARLPLFDRIFSRIGAHDDLAAGQSTFMVEMVETAQILHRATPQSLVILDEVGRGTSTYDGMAIARSVIEFLHNRKEGAARTLFATHYHELTALEGILPRVRNAHVAVREEGAEIVFEHRVVPGPADRSYGIHVARLAGLPRAVVARAEHLLAELEAERAAHGRSSAAHARNGSAPEPAFQPPLFGGPSPVEAALAALDVDGMTPIEAIQKLYELRAMVLQQRVPR
ncbi:DNA mismatch repair protein MutS [Tepidiforma bonchosmolovskayae]|uniref:DNA mismatch repair protein MutS n=1 Tax=Tepidiforma bonchosmolovskayae TaxID=2601677 RepID=A0ABX6C4S5_9CHLR|nr:DNA mismatch repair protein MutS [Tepidiforma bonchosmolovskayae]QFG04073.1 DNA mismatch repair protein MutS [Tepidiforma bonchosmolovskayae]